MHTYLINTLILLYLFSIGTYIVIMDNKPKPKSNYSIKINRLKDNSSYSKM